MNAKWGRPGDKWNCPAPCACGCVSDVQDELEIMAAKMEQLRAALEQAEQDMAAAQWDASHPARIRVRAALVS